MNRTAPPAFRPLFFSPPAAGTGSGKMADTLTAGGKVTARTMYERLAHTHFETDDVCHITIDAERIRKAGIAATLVKICPAQVYSQNEAGDLEAEFAACLECGTCRQIAPQNALQWHYPRGGFGVEYRQG